MAATQSMKTPVASAQVVRAHGAARHAARQVKVAHLKPASVFGRMPTVQSIKSGRVASSPVVVVRAADDKVVVIGLAADSGGDPLLDPAEKIDAPKTLMIEGLHPFYDDRVNELVDRINLDISGAWLASASNSLSWPCTAPLLGAAAQRFSPIVNLSTSVAALWLMLLVSRLPPCR